MRTLFNSLPIFLIIYLVVSATPFSSWALDTIIPGDTAEEVEINREILSSADEEEVLPYLINTFVSVRETACMKLGEIGTSASLQPLTNMATSTIEEWDVRREASLSIWKIKYKEDIKSGGDGVDILLALFEKDGDVTKIAIVKGWAMELLGDKGIQDAIPILQSIVDGKDLTPEAGYLKKIARENLILINFINTTLQEHLIEQGLVHQEVRVRIWALKELIKQNPSDLKGRLNNLFKTAEENQDYNFLSYISQALEELKEESHYPALEIEYPSDGATVKTKTIQIIGHTYGEFFKEAIDLISGENTYTKTIIDRDGNPVTKSIKIYYQNEPPLLNPIGNKTINLNQTLAILLQASDPDDIKLLYFVSPYPLPEGMEFNYTTHTFTWTPTQQSQVGAHTVKFVVDDTHGLTDEETVTITVINQDTTPPTITHTPITSVTKNQPITFKATISDIGSGVDKAFVYITLANGNKITLTMQPSLLGFASTSRSKGAIYTATLPKEQVFQNMTYYIEATDKAGNKARTPTYTIKVLSLISAIPIPMGSSR